jgi:hypothetical protein
LRVSGTGSTDRGRGKTFIDGISHDVIKEHLLTLMCRETKYTLIYFYVNSYSAIGAAATIGISPDEVREAVRPRKPLLLGDDRGVQRRLRRVVPAARRERRGVRGT